MPIIKQNKAINAALCVYDPPLIIGRRDESSHKLSLFFYAFISKISIINDGNQVDIDDMSCLMKL